MGIVRVPVTITTNEPNNPAMNVWNVRLNGSTGSNGDVFRQALDAIEAFYNAIKDRYAASRIELGTGMIEDPLGSPSYVADDLRVITPPAYAQSAPKLLAVTISWKTSSASRAGRGRTFIGPLVASCLDNDGTPTGTTIQKIQDAATDLVQASSGANGWGVGVLSHKQRLLRDFTGAQVKDRFTYLSSRRD